MWQKNVRYLDYNAGSGLSDVVRNKLIEILQGDDSLFIANPSSRHRLGQKVQRHLYQASVKVAASIGCENTDELMFTSSGTEASQTVIRSCSEDLSAIIIGAGEHSASYDLFDEIQSQKPFSRELPLLQNGQYDLSKLQHYLAAAHEAGFKRVFVSLFWANNETGVITDLLDLQRVINQSPVEVVLHLDAAQAWSKVSIDVRSNPAHFLTFSAHKIGAPAGVGVIWARSGQILHPLMPGSQSRGLRGGTENVLGIIALGAAAEAIRVNDFVQHTLALRDEFEANLIQSGIPVQIWGRGSPRVSNTSRFSLTSFHSYENWVELLDLSGFAVSHGSACKAKVIEPSRVLLKMGATKANALNSIRISFGPSNSIEDAKEVVEALKSIYASKAMNEGARI